MHEIRSSGWEFAVTLVVGAVPSLRNPGLASRKGTQRYAEEKI